MNATEGVTTTVNVCPQLMEGTLEREVSVFATTSDISARGEYQSKHTDNTAIPYIPLNNNSYFFVCM